MADKLVIYDIDSQSGRTDPIVVTNSFFNWNTVFKSSSEDRDFVVRNESEVYTAHDVILSIEDTGSSSFHLSRQILLSLDNTLFKSSLDLGNIPPGAYTLPIIIRRITASNAVTGNYLIKLQASMWT